jgi:hypothetical protein
MGPSAAKARPWAKLKRHKSKLISRNPKGCYIRIAVILSFMVSLSFATGLGQLFNRTLTRQSQVCLGRA